MSRRWDDAEAAWLLRDRHLAQYAEAIRAAADLDALHEQADNCLGYITLAAQANQTSRLHAWVELVGAARDEALARMFIGGAS